MTKKIRGLIWRVAVASWSVALLATGGCASSSGVEEAAPRGALRILLTNDDGYQSPGIRAVRVALEAAGHEVTMVAPLENRSGSGSSTTTSGSLELREQGPKTWSVGGTPADAVRIGLDVVLADAVPDLVVSGANFGQNIGPSTLTSGTVGAALTAMQAGIPAIAISVQINTREVRTEPRFKSTIAAFPAASALVVRIIDELDRSRSYPEPLLPAYTALNVNYPALLPGSVEGVAWARIGRGHDFHFGYERRERGTDNVGVVFRPGAGEEPVSRADTTYIASGYATITVIDGDIEAAEVQTERMQERLGAVAPKR